MISPYDDRYGRVAFMRGVHAERDAILHMFNSVDIVKSLPDGTLVEMTAGEMRKELFKLVAARDVNVLGGVHDKNTEIG